jgi:hypothetical protein
MTWEQITLNPIDNRRRSRFIGSVITRINQTISASDDESPINDLEQLRDTIIKNLPTDDELWCSAFTNVLFDLSEQTWQLKLKSGHIYGVCPLQGNSRKALRDRFLIRRKQQLKKDSVRDFVKSMEAWKLYKGKRVSMLSLICDGRDLVKHYKSLATVDGDAPAIIKPYIQFASTGLVCELTGIRLLDIWRYFRHSWSNPYESIPGRSLLILIRDSAHEFHPIIGIAALSSASVGLAPRDRYIGWDSVQLVEDMIKNPTDSNISWIEKTLLQAIAEIYVDDFIQQGILPFDFTNSITDQQLDTLSSLAVDQRDTHYSLMEHADYKDEISKSNKVSDWEKIAKQPLFKSKRARELVNLLKLLATFNKEKKSEPTVFFQQTAIKDFLSKIVRISRSRVIGTEIADLTVCGAIAPYNHLIGGKLIAMLATSPEVIQAYKHKYSDNQSIIASSIAGRAIKRAANLVYIGTSSLYGKRPNQYDRIKYPCKEMGGREDSFIAYHYIKNKSMGDSVNSSTRGIGTFHFSDLTMRALDDFCVSEKNGMRVNKVFGEGANPKLRAIKQGVILLGFNGDKLLTHGISKSLYGVKLIHNTKDYLLGFESDPDFIYSFSDVQSSTNFITKHWYERWALSRLKNDNVLSKVAGENLVYPIQHRAKLVLPEEDGDTQMDLHELF